MPMSQQQPHVDRYGAGRRTRAEKGFITTYTKAAQNPASGLSDKCPLCLWEDKDGRIWIGTDGGGINCFDPQTERFTHYPQTLGEK